MERVDEIKCLAFKQFRGKNELYTNLTCEELRELFFFCQNIATTNKTMSVLVINKQMCDDLTQFVNKQNDYYKLVLPRIYCASILGITVPGLGTESVKSLNGFKEKNLDKITTSNIDQYNLSQKKQVFYVFLDCPIPPMLQRALNSYLQFGGTPVTLKLFTKEKGLTTNLDLNNNVVGIYDQTSNYSK